MTATHPLVYAVVALLGAAAPILLAMLKHRADERKSEGDNLVALEELKRQIESDVLEFQQETLAGMRGELAELRPLRSEVMLLRSEVRYLVTVLQRHGIPYEPPKWMGF